MTDIDSGTIVEQTVFSQPTPPRESDSVIWIDTSTETNTTKVWSGSQWLSIAKSREQIATIAEEGPNPYNAATTFNESNVTTTTTANASSDGRLSFISDPLKAAVEYTGGYSKQTPYGTRFTTNTDRDWVKARVAPGATDVNRVRLYESGIEIATKTADSGDLTGDIIEFTEPLTAGTSYALVADNTSGEYTLRTYHNYIEKSAKGVEITGGVYISNGYNTLGDPFNITEIWTMDPYTGKATVAWPNPSNIYAWDTTTYRPDTSGDGSITAHVEYSTDGGATWNRANGGDPVNRRYNLTTDDSIPPEANVRFAFTLNRDTLDADPAVTEAYRSYLL